MFRSLPAAVSSARRSASVVTASRMLHTHTALTARPAGAAADPAAPPPETRIQAGLQFHDRHIFVASNQPFAQWPKRIEEAGRAAPPESPDGTYFKLAEAINKNLLTPTNSGAGSSVGPSVGPRVTVFDIGQSAGQFRVGDILTISESEPPTLIRAGPNRVVDMRTDQNITNVDGPGVEVQRLMKLLDRQHETSQETNASVEAPTHEYEIIAFVCCHTQRDNRCGDRGPLLVDAINRHSTPTTLDGHSFRVRAFPCSHIGGHEFAGNVILFGWKRGDESTRIVNDWFGLVTPTNIAELVASYARFMRRAIDAPSHGASLDAIRAARVDLLREPLHHDPATCASGSTNPGSLKKTCPACEPIVSDQVTKLAHIWRGAMGIQKAEARQIIQQAK